MKRYLASRISPKALYAATAFLLLGAAAAYVLASQNCASGPLKNPLPLQKARDISMRMISVKEEAPEYIITGEYPYVENIPQLGEATKKYVRESIEEFKATSLENRKAREKTALPGETALPPFSFTLTWEPAQFNAEYVSYIIRIESFVGGANMRNTLKAFNYSFALGRTMEIQDIAKGEDGIKKLSDYAIQAVKSELEEKGVQGDFVSQMVEEGAGPKAENFANFTFTPDVIFVYFEKYQVAPGAMGEMKIFLPRGYFDAK